MIDESDIRQLLETGHYRPAFERLVDRLQTKVFHLALSFVRNEAAAADLAQEAFLRVWKALPSYDGRASVSTWVYTITRNVCLTELARLNRKKAISLDAPENAPTLDALVAPGITDAGAGLDAEAMLARLPEKYQRVLRLYYLEERSYEETAELTGLPLGTVKTNLFRARRELARIASASACPEPVHHDHEWRLTP